MACLFLSKEAKSILSTSQTWQYGRLKIMAQKVARKLLELCAHLIPWMACKYGTLASVSHISFARCSASNQPGEAIQVGVSSVAEKKAKYAEILLEMDRRTVQDHDCQSKTGQKSAHSRIRSTYPWRVTLLP